MSTPFLNRGPAIYDRDPALYFHDGTYHCLHTAVEEHEGRWLLFVDAIESPDLANWSAPRRLTSAGLNYSSPGNILRVGEKWVACLQSYPVDPGASYGSEASRLWLMDSTDLREWSEPYLLEPAGCQANWAHSHRQIDPYLVEHDGQYWCFYKTEGNLGLLVSEDLKNWTEASPDLPVLSAPQTPDGSTLENPCVIHDGEQFVLFFSPCRPGRGIGVARSSDLLTWNDVHYLDFPNVPWAPGGPSAAMVLDTRPQLGHWTMAFHGDTEGPHGGALGLAKSVDLENWELES